VSNAFTEDQEALRVNFYRTDAGKEPVRDWLLQMDKQSRKAIGEDIKVVQLRWPLGMPLVRKIEASLWEIRSHVKDGIARVFFTVDRPVMVLLHGFIKKSQRTPANELQVVRCRLADAKKE
jgi:phage-related protein